MHNMHILAGTELKANETKKYIFNIFCLFYQSKGQLISEEILVSSNLPKSKPFFVRISALASKMGQIKKIKGLYYIKW